MKKIIAVLITLTMVLSLCACGGSSGKTADSSAAAPAAAASSAASSAKSEAPAAAASESAPAGETASSDLPTYEFIVQNHDPSTSICAQFLEDWTKEITEATDGRVQFVIYHGGALGSGAESVDLVINGTADICWTSAGMYTGRFPLSEGFALAGIFTSGVEALPVYWDTFQNFPDLEKEWGEVKVLGWASLCGKPIGTANKKIETLDDFKGLRLRSTQALEIEMLNVLGAVPMSFSIVDSYENLEKSVCDGVLNDWHNQKAFSLQDVLHYESSQQLDYGQHGVFMNWDSYNSMDPETKAIFDQYTGEYVSKMMAEYWDSCVDVQMQASIDAGNEIYDIPEDVWQAVIDAGGVAFDNWVKEKDAAGYNASGFAKALAESVEKILGADRLQYLAKYK